MNRSLLFVLPILLLAALAGRLAAQDLRKIVPPPAPAGTPGAEAVVPIPPVPAPEQPERVIVPELRGLYFTAEKGKAAPASARGIVWDGVAVPGREAVEAKLRPLLGKPFKMGDLALLIGTVQDAYVAAGRPYVRALVPEQDVTDGVLAILVVESKVGKVEVQGQKWYAPEVYTGDMHTQAGNVLNKSVLDSDLEWTGRRSGGYYGSEAFTRPGSEFGTTDVILRAQERFPLGGYVTWDNGGQQTTGPERLIFGLDWENPLGQHLSFQETDSPDFRRYIGHAGTYDIPLPWRHIVHLNGAYASISPDVPLGFVSSNYAWQTGGTYEVPLPRLAFAGAGTLTHSVQAGFEAKETNNNLQFGGTPVTNNTTQIFEWTAGYNAQFQDRFGTTTLSANVTAEPGGWTSQNNDSAFSATRSGAQAAFAYGNLQLQRTTPLPWGFSHVATFFAQLSGDNLLGSEQFGLGGEGTVRGYDEGIVYGDEGLLVRNELFFPSFSLSQFFAPKFGANIADDHFQPLVFFDYGSTWDKNLLAGEASSTSLDSVGVGFRYRISRYVSLRFDYGWQLDEPSFPLSNDHSRGNFALTASY